MIEKSREIIEKIFSPESYMIGKLDYCLKDASSMGYGERIQKILDLDISLLAKFLFLYESYDGASKSIMKLSDEEKKRLLIDLKEVDLEDNSGRIWMYNHIENLCNV